MSSISNAIKYIRNVRIEGAKVTWPTMKETQRLTLVVFILVFIMALYLLAVDALLSNGIQFILGLKG